MELEDRFVAHAFGGNVVPAGVRVLVAVSGGGDSMALLHLLAGAVAGRGPVLEAVCVDHRTRPGTADEARFVGEVCRGLGVPFRVVELADGSGEWSEDFLRRARRQALAAAGQSSGAARVALGHQADDVAETTVMRLLRGAGLDGLAGIPARSGRIVRPLLPFRRAELRVWLRGRGLSWVEDPTNEDVRRLRARVRHRLLPALRGLAPGIDDALVDMSTAVRRARDRLDVWEAAWLDERASVVEDALALPREALLAEPPASRGRLVRLAAERLGVARSRIGRACVGEVLAALERSVAGSVVPLPGDLEAAAGRDRLVVHRKGLARVDDGV